MAKNKKIAVLVREWLYNNYMLFEAVQADIANYSAIARKLKPVIDKNFQKSVNISSIISAIKREAKNLSKDVVESNNRVRKVLANSDIVVKTNIASLSVKKNAETIHVVKSIIDKFTGNYLHVFEGTTSISIIVEEKVFDNILSSFPKSQVLYKATNLGAIIIVAPLEIITTPGVVSFIYNALSSHQINIEKEMSSYTDVIIIVDNNDINNAFSVLNSLVIESK
ncbi:ACT domain-containing protein [archaeon]|nr:MAG: ACT domain-containing protein [archaeon]